MHRWLLLLGVTVLVVTVAVLGLVEGLGDPSPALPPAHVAGGCARYASPSGSDVSRTGQRDNPLASVAALDKALRPGETGCLLAGTYGSISTIHRLSADGTSGAPITITSAPGEAVKVVGLVEVEGAYTTVSGLSIDGSNNLYNVQRSGTACPYPVSNGLEIDGVGDVFQNNDFYQSIPSLRGIGIGVGWNHPADNAVIRNNRIHDLGQCQAYDQMIYLAHGTDVQIYDNWLWNDPHGWGIQIYPAAGNAQVHGNVIDGAGSGFVIGGSASVAGNAIDHNIILNSTGLPDAGLPQGVGISTCCGLGPGNTFTDNVVHDNPGGIADAPGVTLTNNTTASPNLADPANHDYRTTPSSPTLLSAWTLWDGDLGTTPATGPQTPPGSPAAARGTSARRVRHPA